MHHVHILLPTAVLLRILLLFLMLIKREDKTSSSKESIRELSDAQKGENPERFALMSHGEAEEPGAAFYREIYRKHEQQE